MGRIRTSLSRWSRRLFGQEHPHPGRAHAERWHRCSFDELEERRLLAADIYVGAVYYEGAEGDDAAGDQFYITFQGGADGTQLDRIVIDGDKLGDGLGIGDTLFDTSAGGTGAFGHFPFTEISTDGFSITNVSVVDGGTQLVLDFEGFDAGERLIFSIDVDEQGFLQPNSVAEGLEFEGAIFQAYFHAPHYFDTDGETRFFDEYDSILAEAASAGFPLNLPPDHYIPPSTNDLKDFTAGAMIKLVQTPLPITISGTVFEDKNLDNDQDAEDPGIAGVTVTLFERVGNDFVSTGRTAITDSAGFYKFEDVLPGEYRVVETQPDGYFSVGAKAGTVDGLTRGTVLSSEIITGIALLGGEDSIDNDFAEALPAQLSGHVYHDRDNDGVRDAGEEGIAGVSLEVQFLPDAGPAPPPVVVVTDATGFWQATGLAPGSYRVTELHPVNWLDGLDAPGNAGGAAVNPGDQIDGIFLASAQVGISYDFGELLPGSIHGRVHASDDPNCVYHPGDPVIAGVTVWLLDAQGNRIRSTLTDENGEYHFTDLALGTYGIEEIQPDGYFDHDETLGTLGGGIAANDIFGGIVITSDAHGFDYNFCEELPVSIAGKVYVDRNNNGQIDPDEPGIAGVTLHLLDANMNPLGVTTVTDGQGNYAFAGLQPGTYGVSESQPAGYYDGLDTAGSAGGNALNPGDKISDAVLTSGTNAVGYNFGELEPASIRGRVHASDDPDCVYHPGDPVIAGVTVWLLDAAGNRIASTQTDANGEYAFVDLAPGTYGVEEIQPAGYFDGMETPGSAGGAVTSNDHITQIVLGSGANAVDYNFCEHPPASLSGTVYVDLNNNGVMEANEPGIAGVTVQLLDANMNPTGATTTTDAAGNYLFANLAAGTYGVAELQPAGYFDGLDTAGSAGGTAHNPGDKISGIVLAAGVDAVNYKFGELLGAEIHGRVHASSDPDCVYHPGDPVIAGVTVWLLDAAGNRIRSTLTNDQGEYAFVDLAPGTYGVEEIQPAGYFDGMETIGTAGGALAGDDSIVDIVLGPGAIGLDYNFCEHQGASISGYVFVDGDPIELTRAQAQSLSSLGVVTLAQAQGYTFTRDPGDRPIAGVTLRLGNFAGEPILDSQGNPITTVTDENGHYEFKNLAPGVYSVLQNHPSNYFDGLDTAGSTGGFAVNPGDAFAAGLLSVPANNDAIARIAVTAGQTSVENNFAELETTTTPIFFPPQTPPTTPPTPTTQIAGPQTPLFGYSPILPPNLVQPTYYGGVGWRSTVGNTWHLSVINGGRPRTDDFATLSIQEASARFNVFNWTEDIVDTSRWQLHQRDGALVSEHVFGTNRGIPVTGDWNGDGRDEVGVYVDGEWFLDLNGNGVWDEEDLWARLGTASDQPVVGDWDGDGKDDIGIFGFAWPGDPEALVHEPGLPDPANLPNGAMKNMPPELDKATLGTRTMTRTVHGKVREDLIDHVFHYGSEGDIAVTGDWNGDGIATIGLFRAGTWVLDDNGNGRWDIDDRIVNFGAPGDRPIVGDFDGDGVDEVGVYRAGTWIVDTNRNFELDDADERYEAGGRPGDRPVTGDWDGDGRDEIGVYQEGQAAPRAQAE